MSATLVAPSEDVDLGNSVELLSSWRELEAAIGADFEDYDRLLLVPFTNEEPVSAADCALIKAQAAEALDKLPGLSANTRAVLQRLAAYGGERETHAWKEEDHPRHPKGEDDGGKFAPKEGGDDGTKATDSSDYKFTQTIKKTGAEANDFLTNAAADIVDDDDSLDDLEDVDDVTKATPIIRGQIKNAIAHDLAKELRKSGVTVGEARAFANEYMFPSVLGPEEDPYQYVAQAYLDTWASTSGDSSAKAVAIQLRAKKLFDLDDFGSWEASTATHAEEVFIKAHQKIIDTLLNKTYENTQDWLKNEGIESLTLYRGMAAAKGSWTAPRGDFAFDTVRMQPLSSFTSSLPVAAQFSYENEMDGNGLVMATRVPRKYIFSTAVSGPGCFSEAEFIVMGKKGGIRVAGATRPAQGDQPGHIRRSGSWFIASMRDWQNAQEMASK